MTKSVHIDIGDLVRGLLKGSLQITISSTGKRRAATRAAAKQVSRGTRAAPKKPAKRGRPPLPAAVKQRRAAQAKAEKLERLKQAIPSPRDLFLFLADKYEGLTITEIAQNYGVSRLVMKPFLTKLLAKGELSTLGGRIFSNHRVRRTGQKPKSTPAPIPQSAVIDHLEKNGPSTLPAMAAAMDEPSFHRLIKVTNALKKAGTIAKEGSTYRLV